MLMTLTIPVRILSDAGVGSSQLRAFHCRYSAVLFYITMYISILLLGLISLDRYLKIVKPFGKGALQKVRVGQLLSAAIWVVMLSLALPNIILSDQPPRISGGRVKCTSMKNKAGLLWHEGFNYFCQVAIKTFQEICLFTMLLSWDQQLVNYGWCKHWKQEETACLVLSKSKIISLPAPLKFT